MAANIAKILTSGVVLCFLHLVGSCGSLEPITKDRVSPTNNADRAPPKPTPATTATVSVVPPLPSPSTSPSMSPSMSPSNVPTTTVPMPSTPPDPLLNAAQCPKYPVVLHHGFMSGGMIGTFRGAKAHLEAKGCKVFETEVNAVQTSTFRGQQLAAQIKKIVKETGSAKVNIIAHSQGGLDARWAIAAGGIADKTASLSTLATPHFGTPLADQALAMSGPLGKKAMGLMMNLMGRAINANTQDPDTIAAVDSLTVRYMTSTFNKSFPDVPGVFYQSWSAFTGAGSSDTMKTSMLLGHTLLNSAAGKNDGVVPEASAHWGMFRGVLEADHLDLVGYKMLDSGGFDHLAFLEATLADLAKRGY